ncbi:hypothetical protein FKM82_015798, partial [Ascaphus truei]
FGRRRVVIKKGHRGSSFYFIYSGRVAVCNDEDGSSAFVAQEPTLLQKGAIFGDIALIKGQRRNATVVCMEETEFLVVDKEDFFAHKLDVELEKEFRYRFDFFRSLDIFSHCPAKHIENISEICQTMIFYHGQLVIPDTSESSSITFVTEGSCELLMLVNLTNCPSYHKYLQRQMALHLTNPSPTQQPRPICTNRFKSIMLNSRPLLEPNYERPTLHRPTVKDRCRKMQRDSLAFPLIVTAEHSDVEKTRSRIRWAEAVVSEHRDVSKAPARTFEDIQKAVAAAVYLRIDLLHQGEFVGLNEYLLPESQRDTRSKVLVSKGTKTILLKKEQFERFGDAKTLEKLQRYQRSYPSDDDLCQLFLEKNDWKIFKKDLVASVLQPLASTQAQKKKMKKVTTNFQRAGILDLCSISPNSQQGKSQEERRLIVIPTHGREGYLKPPDTSLRLIHGIAVPRRPKLKGLIG